MIIFNELKREILAVKKDIKDLRNFGLVVGGVFIAIGLILFPYLSLGFKITVSVGVALVGFGFFTPKTLLYTYLAWMSIAVVLGFIVFRILLVVIYIFVIIPTGLVVRFLSRTKKKDSATYWIKHE